MTEYITVRLTKDQINALIAYTYECNELRAKLARKENMGLSQEHLAFTSRLLKVLKQAKS